MSYGPFSKTVYANFSETRNISGILQGKEVSFSPSYSLCSRHRCNFLPPLKYPVMIRSKIAKLDEWKTFILSFRGKIFNHERVYVYGRVVLRSSEKYLSRSSKLLEINATDIENEKIVNFASVAREA